MGVFFGIGSPVWFTTFGQVITVGEVSSIVFPEGIFTNRVLRAQIAARFPTLGGLGAAAMPCKHSADDGP